jgi:hypothetical protein
MLDLVDKLFHLLPKSTSSAYCTLILSNPIKLYEKIWGLQLKASDLFENMVAVAFQNTFHVEMYQNNIFFCFLKIIFEISESK